uniref:Conotoxin Mr15.2 n=1 Tax=Conus marmoreus TaxID=42752 RepID=NF2_CONMR|nr:RecName: Full=Conotoxin Mr15.2; AltName: Full=Mr094; Flags: Precursor [Conus marmoreus]
MSTLKMMLLILLLLLPMATFDSDGQAIPGGGIPSAVNSRVGGDEKSGRSLEKRCRSGKTCPRVGPDVCCERSDCFCKLVPARPFWRYRCICL